MSVPIFCAVLHCRDSATQDAVTIPFPIPQEEYDHRISMLNKIGAGDAVQQDCCVDSITTGWPVLKKLVGQCVNVDELDCLAKRLECICDDGDDISYLAMADKLKIDNIKDFINLTFCCQQATVVSDFTKLKETGKQHYLNIHGGCCSDKEWESLDGEAILRDLFQHDSGTLTPYGVLFDNGAKMKQLYTGKTFPAYGYGYMEMSVIVKGENTPVGEEAWFGLPTLPSQIERELKRAGLSLDQNLIIEPECIDFPLDVLDIIDIQSETLTTLNELCMATNKQTGAETRMFLAAIELAEPKSATQLRRLADSLDQFNFVAGVEDAVRLGGYMIQQSGTFDYDPNLDDFYDFKGFGEQWINGGNGLGVQEDIAYTLTATDHHAVFSRQRVDVFAENDVVSTESARQHKDATDLVYQATVGALTSSDRKGPNSQYVGQDKLVVDGPLLIRRLTPLECERLQGFPDGWTLIGCAADSARYKALGNSVAIPCVEFVVSALPLVADLSHSYIYERFLCCLWS